MKKILITGASGLIGNYLLPKILDHHEVYVLGRSQPAIKHSNLSFIFCDFLQPWSSSILPEKVDFIIHLAQSEMFRDFPQKAKDIFNVNVISTLTLLDYAQRVNCERFVYASSGGLYGNNDSQFREDAPINPINELGFYLGTKFYSETLLRNYAPFLDFVILRFFFVYGKGQRKSMLIPRLVSSVKSGIPITLNGESGIKLNPIFADEAAGAVAGSLKIAGHHIINVAGPEILTLKEISEIIGKQTNATPVFECVDQSPKHLTADISKMKELLFSPETNFSVGISTVIKEF